MNAPLFFSPFEYPSVQIINRTNNLIMKELSRLLICATIVLVSCTNGVNNKKEVQLPVEQDAQIDSCDDFSLVSIDTSFFGLKIYYPACATVALKFGTDPDPDNAPNICFACAAAYTGRTVYSHKYQGGVLHSDVAGKHIYDGVVYEGYECDNNTGGFVSYGYNVRDDGILWDILNREDYLRACSTEPLPHSAFGQELLIYKGIKQDFVRNDRPELYRALCRLNDCLCVIDGTHPHLLASFVDLLLNAGVTDALYLDMGDWKYSWFRQYPDDYDDEAKCKETIIYNKPDTRLYFGTNWLVFYYVN